MNKTEFLAELQKKEWCGALVGEPQIAEQKSDGTNWYVLNIRDESDGACVYRNLHFYVVDEGLSTERVFEKDKIAESVIVKPPTPFTDKVAPFIENSGNIILDEIHEDSKVALVRFYDGDLAGVTEKRYLVNEDGSGNLRKIEIV
jgi:hypothetical protein